MTEPRECIEVAMADMSIAIRIENTLYYWTSETSPDIGGMHKGVADAMLNYALRNLSAEWVIS